MVVDPNIRFKDLWDSELASLGSLRGKVSQELGGRGDYMFIYVLLVGISHVEAIHCAFRVWESCVRIGKANEINTIKIRVGSTKDQGVKEEDITHDDFAERFVEFYGEPSEVPKNGHFCHSRMRVKYRFEDGDFCSQLIAQQDD